MACRVVPDDPSVEVPHLGPDDLHALNRLTAYNRPELEGSDRRCGCFHCGSVFLTREVAHWMAEKDGADTALCPHCGCDAVVPLAFLVSVGSRTWYTSSPAFAPCPASSSLSETE